MKITYPQHNINEQSLIAPILSYTNRIIAPLERESWRATGADVTVRITLLFQQNIRNSQFVNQLANKAIRDTALGFIKNAQLSHHKLDDSCLSGYRGKGLKVMQTVCEYMRFSPYNNTAISIQDIYNHKRKDKKATPLACSSN